MALLRQHSFAAGELSPALWGRVDLEQFSRGLARCYNFLVSKHGAAVSRPGTALVREVKDSSKTVRLIPFVYSDSQSYVLEFGDAYVRFHSNGGTVLSGGSPYEVVSPYAEADLPRLKVAQSGDVLFITHPSYTPRTLTRTSHTSWAFATLSFATPAYWDFEFYGLDPLPAADATHLAEGWEYGVTVLGRDVNGSIIESQLKKVTQTANAGGTITGSMPATLVSYPDRPFVFVVPTIALLPGLPPNVEATVGYRVYKGRNGIWGLVGEIAGWYYSGTPQWSEYGVSPDYARPPPSGRNPFDVYNTANPPALVRTEEPACVTFFEDRLVFGGTAERPDHLFASASSSYLDFDSRTPSTADEAIELELASRRREEIRSIVGTEKKLLALTGSSAWGLSGADGAPLAATDIPEAKVMAEIGASWVDPLVIGQALFFARVKGSGVRALSYDSDRGAFASVDASILSQHLFDGHAVADWAYAEDPWGVAWVARDDGALLSFSYDRELGLAAWAQHETDGTVERVCSVPESTVDGVYLVVKRTINGATKRYVERMTDRTVTNAAYAVCLDCAATYDGAAATTISGLSHLEGEAVYALADGVVVGPLTVSGGAVTLPEAASLVHVGLRYLCELELLDVPEGRTRKKTVHKASFEVVATRGLFAGEDFSHLVEWRQRTVAGGYSPPGLETGLAEVRITHTWNLGGRAVLRQVDPLPCTVAGVVREVEVGG